MTIENGADMAANDTLLPDDQIDGQEPDEVEVDYNGKSYCLPPELKDALLRQADYTRKTQELAEGRRALEAARVEHTSRWCAHAGISRMRRGSWR